MADTIRVAILKVDSKKLEVNDSFEHTLDNMQAVVGGYIEAFRLDSITKGREVTVWLNEEGKLDKLPPNFAIVKRDGMKLLDVVVGNVLITSSNKEGDTVGLSDDELDLVKEKFDMNHGLISPVFVEKTLFV